MWTPSTSLVAVCHLRLSHVNLCTLKCRKWYSSRSSTDCVSVEDLPSGHQLLCDIRSDHNYGLCSQRQFGQAAKVLAKLLSVTMLTWSRAVYLLQLGKWRKLKPCTAPQLRLPVSRQSNLLIALCNPVLLPKQGGGWADRALAGHSSMGISGALFR